MRTHARTHMHTHTHTHMCAHTRTHTYRHTHRHANTHARTHTRTHTHTHTHNVHPHPHTHAVMYVGMRAYRYMHTCTGMHAHMTRTNRHTSKIPKYTCISVTGTNVFHISIPTFFKLRTGNRNGCQPKYVIQTILFEVARYIIIICHNVAFFWTCIGFIQQLLVCHARETEDCTGLSRSGFYFGLLHAYFQYPFQL